MSRQAAAILLLTIALGASGASGSDVAGSCDLERRPRQAMVSEQIEARGVRDPAVLRAMRAVPRHEFVPANERRSAYDDRALPIGHGQTISQPYIVALMTLLAGVQPGERVLEVGTGSGYQAAVLVELGADVYSIEIIEPLSLAAQRALTRTGHARRVAFRVGDGHRGWPEAAPFDAIVVTAAPERVPPDLLDQLAPGGRLVIPVGGEFQVLEVHHRTPDGITTERVLPVRFVPLVGGA